LDAQRKADDALDHDSPLEELFEDQLTCADMIVMNKADLVNKMAYEKLEADFKTKISPSVKVIKSMNGSLSADVLLGLEAATEAEVHNRKSHHEKEHDAFHAEHGDDAEHHHDHDHDEFESFVVEGRVVNNRKDLIRGLGAIIEHHDILRLKGFVAIKDKPMRLVVQAVGTRIDHYFDREWQEGEEIGSRLVVIGLEGLKQEEISKQISKAMG